MNLNPMTFYSAAQMRVSRESYFFSRYDGTVPGGYATETFRYRRLPAPGESFCIKTFCDRVKPETPDFPGRRTISSLQQLISLCQRLVY